MARKKKKEVIDILEIESIGFNGVSVAKKDEFVYFVKGGVPGDKVEARQFRKKKSYAESKILQILEPSPHRIDAPCKYFGTCGGCSWQNMPYDYQLTWKKNHVQDAFFRQNKLETTAEVEATLPSPKMFNYRNKMEFSFASSRWLTQSEIERDGEVENKHYALGLHIPGRFDKVLHIDNCLISDEITKQVFEIVNKLASQYEMEAFDRRNNSGYLKNLIMRSGDYGNQILLILVTNSSDSEEKKEFIEKLAEELKTLEKVTGFIHATNSTPSPVKIEHQDLKFGSKFIYQDILDIKYEISPFSFFQTNSFQLDNFIEEILNTANISDNDIVWDLYCGTGSISLPASKKAKKVIGIELVESSIRDAKNNANINSIENTEFYAEDLHKKDIPELLDKIDAPDVVILDPPRAGLHKNLVEHLIKLKAKKIVYVSCNPMTQARDCALLSDIYQIDRIKPVDMFPHTYHIENIALMTLRD